MLERDNGSLNNVITDVPAMIERVKNFLPSQMPSTESTSAPTLSDVLDSMRAEIASIKSAAATQAKQIADAVKENALLHTEARQLRERLDKAVWQRGEKGEKGEKGDVGPMGPQGARGTIGTQGIQGPQGPRGEKGDVGDFLAVGPQGPRGPKGEKGDIGPRGWHGLTGPQGPQGKNAPRIFTPATLPEVIACPKCGEKHNLKILLGREYGNCNEATVGCVKCKRQFDVSVRGARLRCNACGYPETAGHVCEVLSS